MESPDTATTKVVGTGAFKFVEWVPGDHYHHRQKPELLGERPPVPRRRADVKIFRDAQAMVAALEAGTLDVADLVPIPDADRLQERQPLQDVPDARPGSVLLRWRSTPASPPTDNKLLRQAINYAIDRKRFTDTVMKGFTGEVRALPWAKSSPAFDAEKNKAYAYDLDKAKSLLAQSGLSNVEFDIAWATAGYASEYEQLATIIQGDLAKIGIKTNLKPTDPPTFTQQGLGMNPPFNGMRLSAGAFCPAARGGLRVCAVAARLATRTTRPASTTTSGRSSRLALPPSRMPNKRKQMYSEINDYLLDQAFAMAVTPYPDIDMHEAQRDEPEVFPVNCDQRSGSMAVVTETNKRVRAAEAYLKALRTGEASATEMAAPHLAPDVVLHTVGAHMWGNGPEEFHGYDDVLKMITGIGVMTGVYRTAPWTTPVDNGDGTVTVSADIGGGLLSSSTLTLQFNANDQIDRIEQVNKGGSPAPPTDRYRSTSRRSSTRRSRTTRR